MGESSNIDLDKLMSFSNDLVDFLKEEKDLHSQTTCLNFSEFLQSSSESNYSETLNSIEDYEKKIEACRQRTEKTKSEVADDSEITFLHKELAEGQKKEQLLGEELRDAVSEISELNDQRISVEEQKKKLLKIEQDEKRAVAMLSFYASVTKIIPHLDEMSKVSGDIIDRDTRAVQKFELDTATWTSFNACNILWRSIDMYPDA